MGKSSLTRGLSTVTKKGCCPNEFCTLVNQSWNRVTSILAIDIKGAFDNVHKGVLLKTMLDMDLPEASKLWVSHFLGGRRTSLIIDGKVTEPRRVDSGIPQGSPISPILFLSYTSSLYRKIKENARWHRYLDSLIETNAFENTCLLYMSFCYIIYL